MKLICPENACCGCKACHDICPRQCISMIKRDNGFHYPSIDEDKCINCGLCQKVCPQYVILYGNTKPQLFAAYSLNNEHRDQGSSGGVFGELARQIIIHNGVVYGAAFDKDLQLKHIPVHKNEELQPIFKSKYVESDTNNVFNQIKKDCNNNTPVLFCGTPCQCAALKKFLSPKIYPHLYVIDFLCHGVPSQDLFNKSVKKYESKHHGKIISFNFRSKPIHTKKNCDHYFSLKLLKKNGAVKNIKNKPCWEFPYYSGFCRYNTLRPSCYDCVYANPKRVGDITLGDFWGLDTITPIFDFKKGYSTIIINNDKGKELFKMIENRIYKKEHSIETLIKLNPTYSKGAIKTIENQQSIHDYSNLSYDDFEKKYLIIKMDIISRSIRLIKRIFNNTWKLYQ